MAAFTPDSFSPIGGHHSSDYTTVKKGFAEYSYITNDTLAQVMTSGYFNYLRDDVFIGDCVHVSAHANNSVSAQREYAIITFNVVHRTPLVTNVSVTTKKMALTV